MCSVDICLKLNVSVPLPHGQQSSAHVRSCYSVWRHLDVVFSIFCIALKNPFNLESVVDLVQLSFQRFVFVFV